MESCPLGHKTYGPKISKTFDILRPAEGQQPLRNVFDYMKSLVRVLDLLADIAHNLESNISPEKSDSKVRFTASYSSDLEMLLVRGATALRSFDDFHRKYA